MKDINNMSDIEIMAINKMHLEDKIKRLENEIGEKDKLIASAESRIESAYENILIEKDKVDGLR